ncbi:MAG TPA: lytic transglycosylase domain-containing protein [Rhizomicrobium sp.]
MAVPSVRLSLSRIPFRQAARWVFLAAVAAALYHAPDLSPPPPRPVATVVPKKPSPPPKKRHAAPKGPTVFQQEAAMSLRELMARWDPLVAAAAKRFKISEAWIRAVMRMESGGRTMLAEGKPIVSSAGAMGIMQLMPDTYATMRALYGLGPDPHDPGDNIMAGTAYLRILYNAYGYPQMFAAYNDGPKMLEAHNAGQHPWPVETVNYIAGIDAILSGGSPGRVGGAQVRLTRPDGAPVMIDAAAVVSIRAALPGEYAPNVQTVIGIQRMRQGVRESVAAARAVIRAHGGRI